MVRSRTSTAPTCFRSQVARVATTRATFMKYSSQLTRLSIEPSGGSGMLPHGADARQPRPGYDGGMARPLLAALALLAATPAHAQRPLEPSGRLPPVPSPGAAEPTPEDARKKAVPVEPPAPMTRGAVLEQVSGVVREVDRKDHKIVVEAGGQRVTLAMDRNTMVYTSAGLGT